METVLPYVLYVFLGVVLINIGYYFYFFYFAFAKAKTHSTTSFPSVSLIVCSKNEAENLKKHIPLWLSQDYPNFELVLINDASIDETEAIIETQAQIDARITQVHVENNEAFWGNKKYALTLGIKAAKYNHLLFTDADCIPNSNQWIKEMMAPFSGNTSIILGYGGYQKIKGSLVNALIRFETVLTAMQYFSYGMSGRPYMGVGRNLAYTKELFFEQRGFMDHMHLYSGDDDLFVNQAANSKNVAFVYSKSSFTFSEPKKTFKEWFTQKKRHIHVAKHYKWSDKMLLGLFFASQFWFFVLGICLLAFTFEWQVVLGAIGLRYLIAGIAIGGSAFRVKERDVFYLFPIYEVILIYFQLSIFISNTISKPNRWK